MESMFLSLLEDGTLAVQEEDGHDYSFLVWERVMTHSLNWRQEKGGEQTQEKISDPV
jgi:hypothetical protein